MVIMRDREEIVGEYRILLTAREGARLTLNLIAAGFDLPPSQRKTCSYPKKMGWDGCMITSSTSTAVPGVDWT
jgi:hypothetical protein